MRYCCFVWFHVVWSVLEDLLLCIWSQVQWSGPGWVGSVTVVCMWFQVAPAELGLLLLFVCDFRSPRLSWVCYCCLYVISGRPGWVGSVTVVCIWFQVAPAELGLLLLSYVIAGRPSWVECVTVVYVISGGPGWVGSVIVVICDFRWPQLSWRRYC